jgi:hypothetical protein
MLIVAAFFLIAAVGVPWIMHRQEEIRERQWRESRSECRRLASIAHRIKDEALGELVSFNFRMMERFITVAIDQARSAYNACTVAATAALLVLLVGATAVVTIGNATAQITAGVLTAIGAALSSYHSITFLRTFQMTSKQMSYYYGQPLVHCYLLHAEWLGERFEEDADPENRWKIRHQLIRATLEASQNAQRHLLDLQLGTRGATTPTGAFFGPEARFPLVTMMDANGHSTR